jgi:hemoglobin
MKRSLVIMAIALFCGISAYAQNTNNTMEMKEKSLYTRLGGYDALAGVTDDFLGRLLKDKMFAKFFVGASNDSKKKIRQHIVDFLCVATGGPCVYTGRDMKTVHEGLMITKDEWDESVKHLTATLDKFKVPEKEKSEVLKAVGSLEKDIVEKK